MEGNSMAGELMPGMLGLEMPLHQPHQHHRHNHHHQTPPPPSLQQQQQQHLLLFTSQHPQNQTHHNDADHNASKHVYSFGGGAKVKPAPSSEEEPSSAFGEECGGGAVDLGMRQPQRAGGMMVSSSVSPTPSPWQRMKWTDSMVRLLIMVVYCVGDDAGPDAGGHHPTNSKAAVKKGGSATTAGSSAGMQLQQQQQQQQKKGKWKSVSRAMMEKGYYVSPQQCEDKFNDLNKRYKRVNDILGKGTACRVVENQALLDTMDHLSPKAKEEVRKLLNSKHLFFREMCAYHRSCAAAATANSAGGEVASSAAASALQAHHGQSCEALAASTDLSQLQQQQRCFHPSDIGCTAVAFSTRGEEVGTALKMQVTHADKMGGEGEGEEEEMAGHEEDEEDEDDEDDDDYSDEDDDVNEDEERRGRAAPLGGGGGGVYHHHRRQLRRGGGVGGDEEDEEEDSKEFLHAAGAKRQRRSSSSSPLIFSPSSSSSRQQQQQQLKGELAALTGTHEQQRQWLRWRSVELEERRVGYGRRSLELEKQRFKWLRFSGNKEREMERAKLENERLSLENERMLLLLRQKELELFGCQGGGGGYGAAPDHLHPNSGTSPNTAPSTSVA